MSNEGIMIVPVRNERHLKWIVEMHNVDYLRKRPEQMTLFDNDDFALAELSIKHIILLSFEKDNPLYLTSLKVQEDTASLTVTDDDLEMLGYPFDGVKFAANRYLLIDVEMGNILKPSMAIDAPQLEKYLKANYKADCCSIFSVEELSAAKIIIDADKATIPDESYDTILESLRQEKTKETKSHQQEHTRNTSEMLRVTFPDGTVYCDKKASVTYLQAIEKLGVEQVAQLGIEYCKIPIISKEYSTNKSYKAAQKPLSNGWLLFTHGTTTTKYLLLRHIADALNVKLKIERGTDFKPISTESTKIGKVVKNSLLITLPDGTFIAGAHARDTYLLFIEKIGYDKVRRLNIDIQGIPAITSFEKNSTYQVKVNDTTYVTIPNGTKKMYKYVRLIAALTHTAMEVTII